MEEKAWTAGNWYHLLIALAGAGLFLLLIHHLFFGGPPKEFICILVNQQTDYERDEQLSAAFAEAFGTEAERILVASDYVFSYDGVRLEGANESSYEKFFFQWLTGGMDAVLMPESFYRHCTALEYEFADMGRMLTKGQEKLWEGRFLDEGGCRRGLYIDSTWLAGCIQQEEGDRAVLAFLPESEHMEADRAFLTFLEGTVPERMGQDEKTYY